MPRSFIIHGEKERSAGTKAESAVGADAVNLGSTNSSSQILGIMSIRA
jgi:hypothetical protein